MDVRYAYFDATIQPLFSRPSPELLMHSRLVGNRFLVTRDTADKTPEGPPFYAAGGLRLCSIYSGHAKHFPALLCPDDHLFSDGKTRANLSNAARRYLADLGIAGADADHCVAGLIPMHALAIGYSPSYLAENADGIRLGWPRVPCLIAARRSRGQPTWDSKWRSYLTLKPKSRCHRRQDRPAIADDWRAESRRRWHIGPRCRRLGCHRQLGPCG